MDDREFLAWIHERMEFVNGESPLMDYMHKLRAIVLATPKGQRTFDMGSGNNSADMRELMQKEG